jgi:uncharacterized membrane protein
LGIIEVLKQSELGEMLITLVVAMTPVLELRGAIPLGVSIGLNPWTALIISVVGNMIPVPFIIIFIRKIFRFLRVKSQWLERSISRLEKRAKGKWKQVYKFQLLGLLILVAIPLPGTGAWTGALVAALMDMRLKNALVSIFFGVLIAGILITGLTFGFKAVF